MSLLLAVTAGGGNDVNVSLGVLTLTKYSPTVTAVCDVNAGLGALTLSPQAASVSVTSDVNVNLGTLSLSAFSPTVDSIADITVNLGSLVLTGYGPTVDVSGEAVAEEILAGSGWPVIYYHQNKKKKHKNLDEILDQVVRELYEEVSPVASKEASEIVRPYAEKQARQSVEVIPSSSVDWMALSTDLKAAERLFEIWKREQIRKEDDDIIMLYVSEYM